MTKVVKFPKKFRVRLSKADSGSSVSFDDRQLDFFTSDGHTVKQTFNDAGEILYAATVDPDEWFGRKKR